MSVLIVDAGSTKTDWIVLGNGTVSHRITTKGFNPNYSDPKALPEILKELPADIPAIEAVFYYGSGCGSEANQQTVRRCLKARFKKAEISVTHDLMAVCHAALGHEKGIACILGTGANSCYYDGTDIVSNVSPLGYILGDEGSAAYIGKRLVGDVLKCQFSAELCQLFFQETHLDGPMIINKVYREPMPNRFLGQTSQFCQHHRDNPEIHRFLLDCFTQFFVRNVKNYHRDDLPIHFVGSIAVVYEAELRAAATSLGLTIGRMIKAPLEGLIDYHSI